MKRQCAIHTILVTVLVCTFDFVNGQGNSYLGLWGNVFDSSKKKEASSPTGSPAPPPLLVGGGLADRLHHAAGEWRAEADEVRSRLMQRIGGGGNAGILGKTGEAEWEAASSFMAETFNQLFGNNNNNNKDSDAVHTASSSVTDSSGTVATISTTETLSLLDRMQEKLGLDGKLDTKQLVALAAVQGLALSSLRKYLEAADTAKPSSGVWVESNEASTTTTMSSIYDPRHLPFSKLGVALPDSMVSHFDGEWCLRLQNFANAAGYRSVYLGGVPCSTSTQPSSVGAAPAATAPATAVLHWSSEAAFSLDCGLKAPNAAPSTESYNASNDEESFFSGVSAMLHAARAKASSEFSAALQAKTMGCSLAVSISGDQISPQSSGSGTVLHNSQTLPVFNPHKLNAIKIRVCNLPVSTTGSIGGGGGTITSTTTVSNTSPPINVHGLKVNNRHLAIDSLQVHPSNDCHVALVRLPTRALADGFLLNGYLSLEKGGNTSGTGVYNVGEMTSFEMQIGSLRLLSTSIEGAAGEEEEQEGRISSPPPL